MDAYEIVDLVGDGAEQNFIPRLAKRILQDIAEERDILVLDAVMSLMVSVVVSCDMELFDFVIEALRAIVVGDRLKSPISSPAMSSTISPSAVEGSTDGLGQVHTPSNVVTRGYVRMFLRIMNSHSGKSVKLYNALVAIAKTSHCETDARLSAMKLLFRLRADWANRVFITDDLDNTSLATAMCRLICKETSGRSGPVTSLVKKRPRQPVPILTRCIPKPFTASRTRASRTNPKRCEERRAEVSSTLEVPRSRGTA
jgi:hypothetical protein